MRSEAEPGPPASVDPMPNSTAVTPLDCGPGFRGQSVDSLSILANGYWRLVGEADPNAMDELDAHVAFPMCLLLSPQYQNSIGGLLVWHGWAFLPFSGKWGQGVSRSPGLKMRRKRQVRPSCFRNLLLRPRPQVACLARLDGVSAAPQVTCRRWLQPQASPPALLEPRLHPPETQQPRQHPQALLRRCAAPRPEKADSCSAGRSGGPAAYLADILAAPICAFPGARRLPVIPLDSWLSYRIGLAA